MMEISLFGYGQTMQAMSKIITAPKTCSIYDDKIQEETKDSQGHFLKPTKSFEAHKSDLEIVSPGIPPSHPLVLAAKNLISEYDYFKDCMPPSLWISGSNGKTTTTQMAQALFSPLGSVMGGNIGTPLACLDSKAPFWILETSSFTLHYTKFVAPLLYILLPVREDHIAWHGSFASYTEDKLKPLTLMDKQGIALIPKELENAKSVRDSQSQILFYEDSTHLCKLFGIDKNRLPFAEPFLQDAILAMGAYQILHQALPYERLEYFKIGGHRIEEHRDKQGRLWVDDSKATNVDATLQALKRFKERRIHLILGGLDKGGDFTPIFEFLKTCDCHLYLLGSNQNLMEQWAEKYQIPYLACGNLAKCVESIDSVLQKDEVALLSPAAASFDQFASYKERGEKFLQFAKIL